MKCKPTYIGPEGLSRNIITFRDTKTDRKISCMLWSSKRNKTILTDVKKTNVRKGVTKRTAVLKNRRVTISDKFLLEYHGECVQSWMKKSHRIGLRLSYCKKPSKTFQVSFIENHLATCGWFERRGIEIAHSDAEWMQKGMCRRPVCLRLNMLRRSGRTLSPSSCQKQILMELMKNEKWLRSSRIEVLNTWSLGPVRARPLQSLYRVSCVTKKRR